MVAVEFERNLWAMSLAMGVLARDVKTRAEMASGG
jgi:hypothetical protein